MSFNLLDPLRYRCPIFRTAIRITKSLISTVACAHNGQMDGFMCLSKLGGVNESTNCEHNNVFANQMVHLYSVVVFIEVLSNGKFIL